MTQTLLTQLHAHDRKIFWGVAGIGAITLFAYIYFVSASVLAVIGRKEAELRAGRVSANVAQLESEYATLGQNIDLLMAEAQGFREVLRPHYVSRNKGEPESLSLHEEVYER